MPRPEQLSNEAFAMADGDEVNGVRILRDAVRAP